jgi:hypothetical protein
MNKNKTKISKLLYWLPIENSRLSSRPKLMNANKKFNATKELEYV